MQSRGGSSLTLPLPKPKTSGTDPHTNYLSFELRGDGAVPSVSLQDPRANCRAYKGFVSRVLKFL